MNRSPATRLLAVTVAGLASVAVVGCQSNGGPSASSKQRLTAGSSSQANSSPASTSASTSASNSGPSSGSSTSGAGSASGSSGSSAADFCAVLKKGPVRLAGNPTSGDKQTLLNRVHALEAAAPGELKSDLATLAQYYDTVLGHSHKPPSGAAFQKSLTDFSHWVYQHCPDAMPSP